MRRLAFSAIALTLSATVTYFTAGNSSGLLAVLLPTSASAQSSACAFPTAAAATPEETAWRLFVAANCPGSGTKVIWENWIEQSQLYPASGAGAAALAARPAKRLHGSPLAEALAARSRGLRAVLTPATDCGPMHGPPSNVIKGATICEEARLNPEAATFVTSNNYQIGSGQTAAAQKGTDIEFTAPSIEVEGRTRYSGTDFETRVHLRATRRRAFTSRSIDAHLLCHGRNSTSPRSWRRTRSRPPSRPQSMLTDPLRCNTFGDCNDPCGSVAGHQQRRHHGFARLTPALRSSS